MTQILTTCNGKINQNGICEKCYGVAQTTSAYCCRMVQTEQLNLHNVIFPLPCPFCGSDTEIETTTFGDSMTDYFRVNCKQKGHSLDWWSDTVDEAISVWNERQ